MSDEEHPANSSVLSAQPVLRDDLVNINAIGSSKKFNSALNSRKYNL